MNARPSRYVTWPNWVLSRARPGCFVWLGNGAGDQPGSCNVHNPHYDFNDAISPIGASFWVRLVEQTLKK